MNFTLVKLCTRLSALRGAAVQRKQTTMYRRQFNRCIRDTLQHIRAWKSSNNKQVPSELNHSASESILLALDYGYTLTTKYAFTRCRPVRSPTWPQTVLVFLVQRKKTGSVFKCVSFFVYF
jgi:hypothetical protein